MTGDLRLLTIHAHPDDESSKGSATVAMYADQGVVASLVCCTGGEQGDILNPAMDRPEVRENLEQVRRDELVEAADVLGYRSVHWLGYHDSGMPDSEANADPRSFAQAPLGEAVGRLVAILRAERPHVVVTYGEDQQGYRHPDHLRVAEISGPAFDTAGDSEAYPDAGEPWQPLKMYYVTWSRNRITALHEKFGELDLESPYDERWFSRPSNDDAITTRINCAEYFDRRSKALLAHRTQVDPDSKFWFGLPDHHMADAYPWEDYMLGRSLVDTDIPETDLFAGIE
ncbi:mycothiol conjugate amidase Mca [Candidatus Poriferisocius sp.]|uniref:mycothiol conjugate amidase Mca n=1 Tax=Candidatus Poriferisocius sp. TaxID=3101276 RepID=UPI003B5BFF5E